MFGLMIGFMLVIGLGIVFLGFFRSDEVGLEIPQGGWWPGMWGMGPLVMIFPCLGLGMMLLMFFFRMMAGGGGSMSGMRGRRGPMSWMMGDNDDRQTPAQDLQAQDLQAQDLQTQDLPAQDLKDQPRNTCSACGSLVQGDWSVCPHCGQGLG
jgi:hypothetical protein